MKPFDDVKSISGQSDTTPVSPKDDMDPGTSREATSRLYQSLLADQRHQLQKLLNDWSKCQDHIFDRMLAAHENLAQGAQTSTFEQSQHRAKEFHNGSDAIVNSAFEPGPPYVQKQSSVKSSESLLSLRAGASMRYSTSFAKEVESGFEAKDSVGSAGPGRYMLRLEHWCEEKYGQGEACIRDTDSQNILVKLVLSNAFQNVTGGVILANSIFLGYSSDYAMKNLQDPSTPLMNVVEAAFTVFYAIELLLRMIALGWFYIFSPDWAWNLFDLFLVLTSAWGFLQEHAEGNSGNNSSVLRTARIPKMIRLLRAFRIFKAFRELRLLMNLVAGSMKSMLWASLLISIVSYVTANVFLQAATAALQDGQDGSDSGMSDSDKDHINKYWASLADAMLNLYAAVAGGIDWKDMALSMLLVHTGYCILFLLYIAFFLFVILNTLTSLFISTAIKYADSDHQSMIYNELRKKQEHIRKIRAVFRSITKRDQEYISREDMDMVLQDPKMMAFMSSVEIDSADVEEFFNVLSDDGQQAVDIESFVVGCMKMRGTARSMDLLGLIHRHNIDIVNFKEIQTRLASLQQSISRLSDHQDKDHFDADPPATMMAV